MRSESIEFPQVACDNDKPHAAHLIAGTWRDHCPGRTDADEFSKEAWAAELRGFQRTIKATDDDLRSFTLGAIRSLVREPDSLDRVRAALDALEDVTLGI